MNRVLRDASRLSGVAAIVLLFAASGLRAQAQAPASPTPPPAPAAPKQPDQNQNPFAPQPAPPLPAGMTGSDVNDPRYKLSPGLYDAGEASMGLNHLLLVKKPAAFQLNSDRPDDPKVQATVSQLGIGANDISKIPKPLLMVIAQLAFANSDLAFQGNHLFQGNFYGINIFDISNPAQTSLITSMVCPGGQGDVSVYKNLLFMSVEMPNGRLDCGTQGFPLEPPPAPGRAAARSRQKLDLQHSTRSVPATDWDGCGR